MPAVRAGEVARRDLDFIAILRYDDMKGVVTCRGPTSIGRNAVFLAHALGKERRLPEADLHRALIRKRAHEANPEAHTSPESWTDA
jgi:hypothetical protein